MGGDSCFAYFLPFWLYWKGRVYRKVRGSIAKWSISYWTYQSCSAYSAYHIHCHILHILHIMLLNSFQSLLAFLLWKCFSCRVRTFRWLGSRWSTWRFWSSQASSWCTSCATYYLMLLCPTRCSSWAPIWLLLFGGKTSSLFRAVHEIDK